ncbi:MAG TPA: hypothetical protein VM598_13480 [Bdellovibrionota bacterium]|nr:hypothetical protein [Bdellovibrionota bacterium]
MPAQSPSFKWVRDEDLTVTVYDLRVVNSATHTKASSQTGAQVTELAENGLALRVPRSLCSLGHVLSIELTFRRIKPGEKEKARAAPKKPGEKPKAPGALIAKLVTTGKVTETKLLDRSKDIEVFVRFYQYDEEAWSAFCSDHSKRQLRADAIVRKRRE